MKNQFLLLLGLSLISSCTIHRGSIGLINTQSHAQETWVDIAISRSKTVNFIGIGGNKKTALMADLKNEILFQYKDSLYHSLKNFTLSEKIIFIGPIVKSFYYVTADVYKLTSPRTSQPMLFESLIDNSANPQNLKTIPLPKEITTKQTYSFSKNETVHFITFSKEESVILLTAKIIALNKNSALLATFSPSGNLKLQKVNYSDIFKIQSPDFKMQVFGYSIGDTINFPNWQNPETLLWKNCSLANFNQKYILFDGLKGEIFIKKISIYKAYLESPSFPQKRT